jgi:hypothetical protein
LKGQFVDFFLRLCPARLQQKVVDVLMRLLRSVNGIIALNPFFAAMLLKICINSSLVELRNLKSSKPIVSTRLSLSMGVSPDVACFIEK